MGREFRYIHSIHIAARDAEKKLTEYIDKQGLFSKLGPLLSFFDGHL